MFWCERDLRERYNFRKVCDTNNCKIKDRSKVQTFSLLNESGKWRRAGSGGGGDCNELEVKGFV